MRVLDVDDLRDEVAEEAARVLREGGLVVLPTETVYGLAARADDPAALDRVYEVKGRPRMKAMALHLPSVDMVEACARVVSDEARRLMDRFLPGPLMMLVEPSSRVPEGICSDGPRVGIRVPDHPVASAVLSRVGHLVVATSANLSGRPAPTRVEHLLEDLEGRVDLVLHVSRPLLGLESTVVDLVARPPSILRAGYVPREAVEAVLGTSLAASSSGGSVAVARGEDELRALAAASPGAVVLATSEMAARLSDLPEVRDLGPARDPERIAAGLLDRLRGIAGRPVIVEEMPSTGLGEAILDRIRRYSAQGV